MDAAVTDAAQNVTMATVTKAAGVTPYEDRGVNELIYVVVVILFYAIALMVMLGTQVRKHRRGPTDIDYQEYYEEYIQRREKIDKARMIEKLNMMKMIC